MSLFKKNKKTSCTEEQSTEAAILLKYGMKSREIDTYLASNIKWGLKYGNRSEDTVITITLGPIGHPNLNYSLLIIGKSESDCCNYCGRETVLTCSLHWEAYRQRKQFVERYGNQ